MLTISISMRYFLIFNTIFCSTAFWGLLFFMPAKALTATQSQSIAQVLGADTPLWYVDTSSYQDGGMTLGTHTPSQDKYLILRYVRKEKGHIAHFSLEHHMTSLGEAKCRAQEKTIPYQHAQLGAMILCSSVRPRTPNFVSVRARVRNQQRAPHLEIQYIGPVADLIPLMSAIKRLPIGDHSGTSSSKLSALEASRPFYPQNKQAQLTWPGYALGDEQLFWSKPTQAPQWNRVYHKAIPYIPQQMTLHFTTLLRHSPQSQVVKPNRACGSGLTRSRYEHPQLGPYLLCTKVLTTQPHASATDKTPLVHHLVYASPLAGNKLPHLSFHIHGLPQDMLNMLGQVRLN